MIILLFVSSTFLRWTWLFIELAIEIFTFSITALSSCPLIWYCTVLGYTNVLRSRIITSVTFFQETDYCLPIKGKEVKNVRPGQKCRFLNNNGCIL